jgi:TonB-linked SusC/RagA family outer membrane protein
VLHISVRTKILFFATLALAAVLPTDAFAQAGQIRGTVVSQETGQPLGAVQVFLEGTGRGSITRSDGSFTLGDLNPGTYTVVAQLIGYQPARQAGVTVGVGATATVRLQLEANVLQLQGIVATGLVDPTQGVRSPITVATVSRENLAVTPAGGAQLAIQGKVAGATVIRTTGQPGTEGSVILRTPTSIRGSNAPLMVVDGVILGNTTADIESMDIESIEVIKGAAAASLYGSRAAAGVISITTARGRALAAGQTRFTARSEMGHSFVPIDFMLPSHHFYLTNEAGQYVNAQGQVVPRANRVTPALHTAFMDKPYIDPIYDNISAIWRPGRFNTQNLSIAQNSESTNFMATVNRYRELGSLEGNDGYDRNSFRINLDHRFRNTMTLGISTYASRAQRDEIISGVGLLSNQFYDMLTFPRDVDIRTQDPSCTDGGPVSPLVQRTRCYMQVPDATVRVENPIWRQLSRDDERQHDRQLASADFRWNPASWFSFVANGSYDRLVNTRDRYTPRGLPTSVTTAAEANGTIVYNNDFTNTFNASAEGSLRRDFGPLNARTTLRSLMERDTRGATEASGSNFFVEGLPSITAARDRNSSASRQTVAATGYLWDTALDYDGKYIATILARRDGSSLFGPDARWHNYYRGAVAYRLSEEPWFNIPNLNEFKLKFSQGTAGGRPEFGNRFETWTVNANGVSKGQLGNRALRPEHTTEREFGLDMILFDRIGVELVHARQTTRDQIVNLQVPAITGYTQQWVNAGVMQGRTTELVVESRILNRQNFSWSTTVVADRSRSEITEWQGPCHVQFLSRLCPGTNLQDVYGIHLYRNANELPANLQPFANQFQVNDDGFLVWVGEGNSFRDGRAKNLWGTATNIGGRTLQWGHAFPMLAANGQPDFVKIGSGQPDLNLGWLNTVRRGNLTVHAQLHASVGHEMFNATHFFNGILDADPKMDQSRKPDELKKPMSYYRGTQGVNVNWQYTNWAMEDASYLKLRSVQATYRVPSTHLSRVGLSRMGFEDITLGLTARNIFTITGYSGFDAEGGLFTENRITPQDWYAYPQMRNLTASIEIGF